MKELVTGSNGLIGSEAVGTYDEQARRGDHICYMSDLTKLRRDFPSWRIARFLPSIVDEILGAKLQRTHG